MLGRSVIRRRLIAAGLAALVLGGAAATAPAMGLPTAPPDDTFEIAITSGGTVVAPGGALTFQGTCWSSALNAAEFGSVRGFLVAGQGLGPFDFSILVAVNHNTGAIAGSIAIPGNAPNGAYRLEVSCHTQDQYLGDGEVPFTVDGPQIITTTSSVPPRVTSSAPTAPPPARPLSTTAEFTG
jgi:hypothetical protein